MQSLWMIVASFLFACMGVCVKLAAATHSVVEITFWRSFVALLLLFVFWNLWMFGHIVWWRTHNPSETAFMEEQLGKLQEKNPDADEFLENISIPLEEAYRMIFTGQIVDGKSIIGIQYAFNHLVRG